MDATRHIVESTTEYSNSLSKALNQLECDKLKVAEFYELINGEQKEIEKKQTELETLITEIRETINVKCKYKII